MALKQSSWAKGLLQAPTSREGGGVVAEKYKFTVAENLAAGDIIELGILPAFHQVVEAILIVDEAGTATYDVGIMSGAVGAATNSDGSARTSGNELFAGAADASVTRATKPDGFRIAPVEADRSIGVKLVGAGITAANQVIELVLLTKQ